MNNIRINCFGRLTIEQDGEYVKVTNKKARELIALLVSEKGRPMRKERVAGILWPESDTDRALDNLYKVIRYIRNMRERGIDIPVYSQRGEISIKYNKIETDVETFERLQQRNDIESLKRATEIYTAPFLADEYYEWTQVAQAHYDIRFAETLERLIEYSQEEHQMQRVRYYKQLADNII